MNKTLGIQLIIYSVLLLGLAALTLALGTNLSSPGAIAGVIGGSLSMVWGIRAIVGKQGKALPILTLVPVTFVFLSHSINSIWENVAGNVSDGVGLPAFLLMGMLILSLVMLFRVAWAGEVGASRADRPVSQAKEMVPKTTTNAG